MRVLHVISALGSGGAEKMLVDIIREMTKIGISCEVAVITNKNNFYSQDMKNLNIPVYYGGDEGVYKLSSILFLKRILKKGNYDIVHSHLFGAQLFTPIAKFLANCKVKLVTTEHSTHNKRREKKVFRSIDYWMYSKYDKIVAITEDAKRSLNSYLSITSKNTTVILNGIDLEFYKNAPKLKRDTLIPNVMDGDKVIVMVASLREEKDHETVIKAANLLPSNYKFIFVGDGAKKEKLKGYVKNTTDRSITFLGNRKDVPEILKAADLFVLSSNWEGFGLVVVEAAASGLPVVASDVAGLNSVVSDIGGTLFIPKNEKDLAEKIQQNIENKESTKLYNLAKFSIQKTVSEYIDLYKGLFNI